MTTYKTPDVYIEEISVFPPSVAEVGTAIPAFIGHTEKAQKDQDKLKLKPVKIYSLKEYEALFGGPHPEEIEVTLTEVKESDKLVGYGVAGVKVTGGPLPSYLLHHAVRMYFDNGGAQCYVVSTGDYTEAIEDAELASGLSQIELEDEPTLLVIPEAVKLGYAAYKVVAQKMLDQCGKLGDRFAILDVWSGDKKVDDEVPVDNTDKREKVITASRETWGTSLKYGAAYYPFVKTAINPPVVDTGVSVKIGSAAAVKLDTLKTSSTAAYNTVKAELKNHFIVMPPSGAVTGVYAATDKSRGVWKAPANVPLAGVLEPVVKLTSLMQEDLNVDANTGKSVNAIRAFSGKGTLVWGARTLAGNDNEWRYVSVRRFFNMVEESIKKSTYWAVFEPNDANTWVKVRGMIENYLIDKWRDGALAGASPKDAFFVKCGLGTTMTAQDILQGYMNVEIGMAVVRPAEFIVLKFSHKLQTS